MWKHLQIEERQHKQRAQNLKLEGITDDATDEDDGIEEGKHTVIEGLLFGLLCISETIIEYKSY